MIEPVEGKHHGYQLLNDKRRTGFSLQMVTDAHRQLISVRGPLVGCTHELRALRHCGLPALLTGAAYVSADAGYRQQRVLHPVS